MDKVAQKALFETLILSFVCLSVCLSLSLCHEAASHSHQPVRSGSVLCLLLRRRAGRLGVTHTHHTCSTNGHLLCLAAEYWLLWPSGFFFFQSCLCIIHCVITCSSGTNTFKINLPSAFNTLICVWAVNSRCHCWAPILLFPQSAAGGVCSVMCELSGFTSNMNWRLVQWEPSLSLFLNNLIM